MESFEVFVDTRLGGDFLFINKRDNFSVFVKRLKFLIPSLFERYARGCEISEFIEYQLFSGDGIIHVIVPKEDIKFYRGCGMRIGRFVRVARAELIDWNEIFLKYLRREVLKCIHPSRDELRLSRREQELFPRFLEVFHQHFKADDGGRFTGKMREFRAGDSDFFLKLYLKYLKVSAGGEKMM